MRIDPNKLQFLKHDQAPNPLIIAKYMDEYLKDLPVRPVLIDSNFTIRDGQHRVIAARQLGLKEIEVFVRELSTGLMGPKKREGKEKE